MQTARQLADRVRTMRQEGWDRSGSTTAIVATEKLSADDEQTVRQVVTDAGYQSEEFEEMVRHVSKLVVGQVEALADDMPATDAD